MAALKVALSCKASLLASALLLVVLIFQLPDRTTSSLTVSTNILLQNQVMFAGDHLVQPPYELLMQKDCNLVLYHDKNPLWASNTADTIFESCYFLLQPDGNAVLYNSWQKPLYGTDTWGRNDGEHTITLRSDGNVVMTNGNGDVIWETHTAGR